MDRKEKTSCSEQNNQPEVLQVHVSRELYRAFQRCTWVIINETGRDQLDIMDEMVRDFLVKHGC